VNQCRSQIDDIKSQLSKAGSELDEQGLLIKELTAKIEENLGHISKLQAKVAEKNNEEDFNDMMIAGIEITDSNQSEVAMAFTEFIGNNEATPVKNLDESYACDLIAALSTSDTTHRHISSTDQEKGE